MNIANIAIPVGDCDFTSISRPSTPFALSIRIEKMAAHTMPSRACPILFLTLVGTICRPKLNISSFVIESKFSDPSEPKCLSRIGIHLDQDTSHLDSSPCKETWPRWKRKEETTYQSMMITKVPVRASASSLDVAWEIPVWQWAIFEVWILCRTSYFRTGHGLNFWIENCGENECVQHWRVLIALFLWSNKRSIRYTER